MVHEGNPRVADLGLKIGGPEGTDTRPDQVVGDAPPKHNPRDRDPEVAAADLDDFQGRDA